MLCNSACVRSGVICQHTMTQLQITVLDIWTQSRFCDSVCMAYIHCWINIHSQSHIVYKAMMWVAELAQHRLTCVIQCWAHVAARSLAGHTTLLLEIWSSLHTQDPRYCSLNLVLPIQSILAEADGAWCDAGCSIKTCSGASENHVGCPGDSTPDGQP